MLMRLPATVAPVMPAAALFLFLILAPAYWANAALAPPMSNSYPKANAPLQSVMIATRISPACDGAASDPDTEIEPTATSAASGSRSLQLRSLFIFPPFGTALTRFRRTPRLFVVPTPFHGVVASGAVVRVEGATPVVPLPLPR